MSSNSKLETRTLLDEIRSLEKGCLFDLGHPLLDRMAESFIKAAGYSLLFTLSYSLPFPWSPSSLPSQIGAIQAVSREAYFTAVEAAGVDPGAMPPDLTSGRRHRFSDLRGENCNKSLEAMVKNTEKESFQWGMAAGMYSGLTYGLKEARGSHAWKNNAVAGAVTGAALALTSDDASHEQIVQCAITGAALSTAANLLTGIF